MANIVQCVVLKIEAEGLGAPPHPGDLGVRIYENVSKEGWKQWLERLTTIINENVFIYTHTQITRVWW